MLATRDLARQSRSLRSGSHVGRVCNAFGIETFIPPTSLLRIVCERFRRDSWKTLLLVPCVGVGSSRSKFESGAGVANRTARSEALTVSFGERWLRARRRPQDRGAHRATRARVPHVDRRAREGLPGDGAAYPRARPPAPRLHVRGPQPSPDGVQGDAKVIPGCWHSGGCPSHEELRPSFAGPRITWVLSRANFG